MSSSEREKNVFTPLYDDENPAPEPADLECWAPDGSDKLTQAELVAILQLVRNDVSDPKRLIRPFEDVIRMAEDVRARSSHNDNVRR